MVLRGISVNKRLSYQEVCSVVAALNARLPQHLDTILAADAVKKSKTGEMLYTVSGSQMCSIITNSTNAIELCPPGTLSMPGFTGASLGVTKLSVESGFICAIIVGVSGQGEDCFGIILSPERDADEQDKPYLICGEVGKDIANALVIAT